MINLRKYQQTARHWVNQKLNNGRHPLLVMPTGTGKTKTAVVIIADRVSLNKKLLVLCHQIEIFNQWLTECTEYGLNPGYINDEGIIGRNRNVYICMAQSLDNILVSIPEKFCRAISEIITDETHHSSAVTWRNIYDHFENAQRFGLTATPYRMDNQPLGDFYTDMFEPITMSEAIKKGYLCKPIIIIPEEYKNVVPDYADINVKDQKEYVKEKKIIGDMVKTYKEVFDGLPVIAPCSTHKHAEDVFDMFYGAGWAVDHIHSKMSNYERQSIIKRVKNGETNILITVGIGVEGMDIPGLYGIIWLRFTESLTIYMQFNGRAMRPAGGKKFFIMVDPVGVSVIHGRPDINRKWSLETDYEPGQDVSDVPVDKLCPVCSVMNNVENLKCWICGYDFITGLLDGEEVQKKQRRLPKMIDGQLVYLDGENNCSVNSDTKKVNRGTPIMEKIIPILTKTEKVEILKRDLTGLKIKSKFREGIKYLSE